MIRNNAHRADWIEALEGRRLYSAAPLVPVVGASAPHVPTVSAPKVSTPNVVGTYTGTVVDSNEKLPGTETAVILTQGPDGRITGYVESVYPGNAPHTTQFTGVVTGDSVTIKTSTTTVTATFSANGTVLTGGYVFKSSDDSSVGHFVLTRTVKK
jgi:hypothetical protein